MYPRSIRESNGRGHHYGSGIYHIRAGIIEEQIKKFIEITI